MRCDCGHELIEVEGRLECKFQLCLCPEMCKKREENKMASVELMSSHAVLVFLDTKTMLVHFDDKRGNKLQIPIASLLQITSNTLVRLIRSLPEEDDVDTEAGKGIQGTEEDTVQKETFNTRGAETGRVQPKATGEAREEVGEGPRGEVCTGSHRSRADVLYSAIRRLLAAGARSVSLVEACESYEAGARLGNNPRLQLVPREVGTEG